MILHFQNKINVIMYNIELCPIISFEQNFDKI